MADGDVHTLHRGGRWFSEIEGGERASHSAAQKAEAVNVGREMAIQRRAHHVVHRIDGAIEERNSYAGERSAGLTG